LKSLNWDHYFLDPAIVPLLENIYSGYGFIVCRLCNGAEPHPIAYIHTLRVGGGMFVPTRHEGHAPDWDHNIYMLGSGKFKPRIARPRLIYKGPISGVVAGFEGIIQTSLIGETLFYMYVGENNKYNGDLLCLF
jgi:hypothetical protein